MKTIFLAGVHGVGKGHLGALVAASLDIVHCTASQLIRDEKGRATWGQDKAVVDVDDNQVALISAVSRLRKTNPNILLDGHFVLRGRAGDLIRLSADVFSRLDLSGVILLCDDPKIIARRLTNRDGVPATAESIAELAVEEAAHAQSICALLEIPLTVIDTPTEMQIMDAVARMLAGARISG